MKLPVLIMCPSYAGSLAATRLLGTAGVSVTVASSGPLGASRWSRFATNVWYFEPSRREDHILLQLKNFAKSTRNHKHLLLAPSDELAWLFALHLNQLSEDFLVYSPSAAVIDKVLDKEKLRVECIGAGIPTLATWSPRTDSELLAISHQFKYPLLIKPRCHIFDTRLEKGKVIESAATLLSDVAAYKANERSGKNKPAPQLYPIFQEFVENAVENVVSISGFIDRSGTRSVLRASRKVLQRSRPVGLGLAFEAIDVDPCLADAALKLCRKLGYFGIFEIEFVKSNEVWHLIDFNPRFYREMALDIAAGAPMPLLAYLDASGDEVALDEAVRAANRAHELMPLGFSDIFTTRIIVGLRLVGSLFSEWEALRWHWKMRGRLVDAFWDWRDPLPWVSHLLSEVLRGARTVLSAFASRPRRSTGSPEAATQELEA